MTKKYYLTKLRAHDRQHHDSIVRELEMEVDGIAYALGHSIPFWQDVKTYGVDEAILYLKGYSANTETLETLWDVIKKRISL